VIGMLDSIPVRSAADTSGESVSPRDARAPDAELPAPPALPYRSELLTAVADWVHQWNSPEFTIDIVVRVDPRLSVPGSRVLVRLLAQGPLRPSDLAEQLSTGASNVSKLLAHLETLGYIERSPDASDARVVRVQLTESGRVAARGVITWAERAIDHMLGDWTDDEIRTYTEQTRRLAAAGRAYIRELRSESAEE
jgi:DNA-binding MarR family transcriptional regulator